MLGRRPADGEDVTEAVEDLRGELFSIVVEHRKARDGDSTFLEVTEAEHIPQES